MTNDSTSLGWEVPCDQEFTLSITIGSNTYRMKTGQLTNSTGTVCTSLVKAWADPAIRTYLLGSPFVTTAYIVYNAQQDQTGDQLGLAPRRDDTVIIINQGVPTEVLIAAVVGSVCGVGLIATVLLFFLYRQRKASRDPKTLAKTPDDEKFKVEPFTANAPPNSSTPMLSSSTKQTGYILEQGPIGGEPSEGSELGSELRPQSADRKEPIRPPNLTLLRQSQISEASVLSPELSPHQELGVRRSPGRSGSLSHSYHSFYGARVPSVVISPEPVSEQPQDLGVAESVPPPPYSRPEEGTQATADPANPLPSVREKH